MYPLINNNEELMYIRLKNDLLYNMYETKYYLTTDAGNKVEFANLGFVKIDLIDHLKETTYFYENDMIVDNNYYAAACVIEFPNRVSFSTEPKDISTIIDNPYLFALGGGITMFRRFPTPEAVIDYIGHVRQNDLTIPDLTDYFIQATA